MRRLCLLHCNFITAAYDLRLTAAHFMLMVAHVLRCRPSLLELALQERHACESGE